jgi:hypothetical protein
MPTFRGRRNTGARHIACHEGQFFMSMADKMWGGEHGVGARRRGFPQFPQALCQSAPG